MVETAQQLIGNLTTLAIAASVVVAIAMILWSWVVQRTVTAVIGAIVLAAIVLFAISSTGWLRDRVAEDVGARTETPIVIPSSR